ncbi:MAG: serine/threonine protein kinase [Thermoflexales bacterium]|nr:serine/threonine protein kinase [Thermoflexales bacterium]
MFPEKIGKYTIKREIARGGMATVYEAFDPVFERTVALKVLPPEYFHDETFRARFEREAKTVASIESAVIVPVYDFGEADGRLFLAMRYMGGGTLADRLNGAPMPPKQVVHLLNRIAPGLDRAHARNIVHRDLKPANVLFDDSNEPFLSDFGIAKVAMTRSDLTRAQVIGTPAYMSPEQARGDMLDGRSDLYSLGAMVFEMLTGKPPYDAESPTGVMLKQVMDPIPRILTNQLNISPFWQTIIDRSMAKRPEDRYTTAAAMAADAEAAAEGRPLVYVAMPAASVAPAAPPPPPPVTPGSATVIQPPRAPSAGAGDGKTIVQPVPVAAAAPLGATIIKPAAPQVPAAAPAPVASGKLSKKELEMPLPGPGGAAGGGGKGTGKAKPVAAAGGKKRSPAGLIAAIAAGIILLACIAGLVSALSNPEFRASLPGAPTPTATEVPPTATAVPTATTRPTATPIPPTATPVPLRKLYLPTIYKNAKP